MTRSSPGSLRALSLGAVLILTGCASQSSVTPTEGQPTASAVAPTETTTATASPTAVAATSCVLSIPSQFGTDFTPVVVSYPRADDATCADLFAKQNANATGWAKDHPATRVDSIPTGSPVCSVTVQGIEYVVYGKDAATFVCSSLGASPNPS